MTAVCSHHSSACRSRVSMAATA